MSKNRALLFGAGLFVAATAHVAPETVALSLVARQARWELRPGLATTVWAYNGSVPGQTIVARKGDHVVVDVTNQLPVDTNIHWHGLEVPNDMDGPTTVIAPGQHLRYELPISQTGTYWYHSHSRPVLPQVDRGLYGAIVITAPEDAAYSGDHVLVLDDWYLDAGGRRLDGTARGSMERYGNVETVNGKTGEAIAPLVFRRGELHKLRFVNASSAAVHSLRIAGHSFRVTHTDGRALAEAWTTDRITLSPGERIDVEVEATGSQNGAITSDRPDLGLTIPIRYAEGSVATVASPYVPPASRAFAGIEARSPDYVLELTSSMGGMGGMSGGHGSMMGGMGAPGSGMMRWAINGSSFPEAEPVFVHVGEVVKLRFVNRDTSMMGHPMDHPMHIHGTSFQVVSVNGRPPARETWKDTVSVPAGGTVDIAFAMRNPGTWMLHCHILDHEDGGMMTTVVAE